VGESWPCANQPKTRVAVVNVTTATQIIKGERDVARVIVLTDPGQQISIGAGTADRNVCPTGRVI